MRKFSLFVVMCLILIPVWAGASTPDYTGLWVGGQAGLTIPGNTNAEVQAGRYQADIKNLGFDTGFMAGATVGYNFMKYFGVALDYSWNGLNMPSQRTAVNLYTPYGGGLYSARVPATSGSQNTIAAMMMLHYGLLASETYPNGQVHPYVGVGPALVITTIGSQTSSDIGLMAEAGVRTYVSPRVSLDAAFRYKMSDPSFTVRYATANPGPINTYGFLTRVSYHF